MNLDRRTSQLLLIDMQERLVPAMTAPGEAVARATLLAEAAAEFAIPVTVTEQYPAGLGPTVAPLRAAIGDAAAVLEKMAFSSVREPALRRRLDAVRTAGRGDVVVAGVEAHVCVSQTVLDLLRLGVRVAVVADAVSSRRALDRDTSLQRMREAGASVVTAEAVVFEWLETAATESFRRLSRRIKALG